MHKILIVIAALTLTACGTRSGENVTYALWNRSTTQSLEDAGLYAIDGRGGKTWLAMSSRQDPRPPGEAGWQAGGSAKLPDMGHRVPEKAYLAWRRGEASPGPYTIDLRSRIPADVLEKVAGDVRYQLQIGVGAGVRPLTVRWLLTEQEPGRPVIWELQRGGDW